jgi:hypothetical protein
MFHLICFAKPLKVENSNYFMIGFFPGGVLEAEGTVSIKLRLKDQRKIMERLDVEMRQLYSELKAPELNEEQKEKLETNIKMREEILAPIYHQVTN